MSMEMRRGDSGRLSKGRHPSGREKSRRPPAVQDSEHLVTALAARVGQEVSRWETSTGTLRSPASSCSALLPTGCMRERGVASLLHPSSPHLTSHSLPTMVMEICNLALIHKCNGDNLHLQVSQEGRNKQGSLQSFIWTPSKGSKPIRGTRSTISLSLWDLR